MSKHRTCRVCMERVVEGDGRNTGSRCQAFNKDIKRDKPRCSTKFLERKPKEDEKILDISE